MQVKHSMVAIFSNIRSAHNVGSIFRTADGAGFSKIYLTGITPTPLDRFGNIRKDIVKSALGAEQTVAWEHAKSGARVMQSLREAGYAIIAVEQSKKAIPYYELPKTFLRRDMCFVFGSETRGLSPREAKAADVMIEIPMRGMFMRDPKHPKIIHAGKESLNVVIAFGIVAYYASLENMRPE